MRAEVVVTRACATTRACVTVTCVLGALWLAMWVGCARSTSGGTARALAIEAPPPCPSPPNVIGAATARPWLTRCLAVGRAADAAIEQAMTRAEARGQQPRLACLRRTHEAIVRSTRRMRAERIVLSGARAEKAALRIRLQCLRIHRLVEQARSC